MSALTIEQLKALLTNKGVQLPPSGSKKSEYLKLYEQHVAVNDSLVEAYSSDEDSPITGSWSVSSSSSPLKHENAVKEVGSLSDDELFAKLHELGVNTGPIVPNTRRVYEKKLVKILTGENQGNGDAKAKDTGKSIAEFSDSDIEVETQKKVKARGGSSARDSPKPSVTKLSTHVTKDEAPLRAGKLNESYEKTGPTKFSFIETVSKDRSERFIEPSYNNLPSSSRSRFSSYKSVPEADHYVGTWNPTVNIGKHAAVSKAKSGWVTKVLGGAGIAVMLAVGWYIYYQWTINDPYKAIQDDAEREILQHATQSSGH